MSLLHLMGALLQLASKTQYSLMSTSSHQLAGTTEFAQWYGLLTFT